MKTTILVAAATLFLAMPAMAETPTVTAPTAPQVTAPTAPTVSAATAKRPAAALTAAQQAKVAERVAIIKKQLVDLSPAEQAAVMRDAKPERPTLSDADKEALRHKHFAMASEKWNAKSATDKAELRNRAQEKWNALTPSEKAYKRDRIAEQLKAIPAADRQQIIDAAR